MENYIKVKCGGEKIGSNYVEAQSFISNALNEIREQFENIDSIINVLDERNTKYVTTSTARLRYLMNESADVEGKVYDILKAINNKNVTDNDCFEFSLKEFGRVDDSSILNYTRKKRESCFKINFGKT